MISTHILEQLQNIRYITDIREITYADFADVDISADKRTAMKKNGNRFYLFQFTYVVKSVQIVGFLTVPRTIDMRNKTKVLMCLRGGSNDFGAIKTGFFFNKQTYFSWFSLSTYITITTQHRGTSGCTGTDEFGGKDLDDIRYLYKILQKLPFCDTEHIGIFGWSRGAQMVYQLLKTERWIKSAVCIAGPTDHIRMVRDAFRPEWKKHLEKLYGGSISETKKRSALYWAYKMNPVPLLIMHGTSDDRANVQDSIDLHALLPHSTLRLFKGDDHSLTHNFNKARLATMKWFNATL